MFRSSTVANDLDFLVGAFITRWGINDDVASQLTCCSPEVQWQVVAPDLHGASVTPMDRSLANLRR